MKENNYISPAEIKAQELWDIMNAWYIPKRIVKRHCVAAVEQMIERLRLAHHLDGKPIAVELQMWVGVLQIINNK